MFRRADLLVEITIRPRVVLLGLTVGIVLADSSVVTLALPTILAQYDVEIATLSWVLASYNLALAVSAIPAAFAARRWPARVFGAGTTVFAAASLTCAFAPSIEVLIGARAVQGTAGAAVVCAALDLLSEATGGEAPAARVWALSGILGAALGPAAGGFLTQLLGWESIFVVQAPMMLLALVVLRGLRARPVREPSGRPHVAANLALLIVSGALVGASFLLVLLLINGWRLEPLEAGLVVTVLPLAAIVAARMGGRITPQWARAASGAILIAGGSAALGLLPHAGAAWTIAPQLAIGAGLGLALSALTERALAGRSAQAVHGGWTIAARHAGIVLGLLLLTPLFTADLERNEEDALAAGTAVVLDSEIPPLAKVGVARDILVAVDEAALDVTVPDVTKVVDDDDEVYRDLASKLQQQLDRAVTNAFSRSFLVAAALGLLALVPILLGRREVSV
jgi:predicted MFS family arabinose efflux permease